MMVLPHSNRMEKKTATFVLASPALAELASQLQASHSRCRKVCLVATHQQRVVTVERLLPGL
jgi:hypothetical protein